MACVNLPRSHSRDLTCRRTSAGRPSTRHSDWERDLVGERGAWENRARYPGISHFTSVIEGAFLSQMNQALAVVPLPLGSTPLG
jgi:hypothetical protein